MFTVISWDWKAQPKIEELNEALKAVFELDANYPPVLTPVFVGSGDDYTVVVSTYALSEAQAKAAVMLKEERDAMDAWEDGMILPDFYIDELLAEMNLMEAKNRSN